MGRTGIILIIIIAVIIIALLLTVLFIPIMSLFNSVSDQPYQADEKNLLVGRLTVGIDDNSAVGEVMTEFVNESRKTLPARIYHQKQHPVTSISKNEEVLIIEVSNGVAYVIPYRSKF